MDAMRKLPYNSSNRKIKIDIYINRSNKNGGVKKAEPCHMCIKHMSRLSNKGYIIKNVYYPEDKNIIVKKTLKELVEQEDKHVSNRFKYKNKYNNHIHNHIHKNTHK